MKQSVYLLNDLTVNDRNCTSHNVDYSWMRFPLINDSWIGEVFWKWKASSIIQIGLEIVII